MTDNARALFVTVVTADPVIDPAAAMYPVADAVSASTGFVR